MIVHRFSGKNMGDNFICLLILPLNLNRNAPPLVSSFEFEQPFVGWKPSDLRVLRAPQFDQGHPEIIAVYSRVKNNILTIRIDFTENISLAQFDLELVILPSKNSANPSINRNSFSGVTINLSGSDDVFISGQSLLMDEKGIAIHQDEILKSIVIFIPYPPSVFTSSLSQANVTLFDNQNLADMSSSDWFHLNSTKIIPRAPLVLALTSALKTGTPSELLRSWNGAHTGPLGKAWIGQVFLLSNSTVRSSSRYYHAERLAALSMLGQLSDRNTFPNELVFLTVTSLGDLQLAASLKVSNTHARALPQEPLSLSAIIRHTSQYQLVWCLPNDAVLEMVTRKSSNTKKWHGYTQMVIVVWPVDHKGYLLVKSLLNSVSLTPMYCCSGGQAA